MKKLVLKLARYAAVSAVSTTVTLTLLGTLVWTGAMTAGWANILATAAGTVPSFELNRRWVWSKRSHPSLWREVLPFCSLSFAELGLSTAAVAGAATWAAGRDFSSGTVALVSLTANVLTFGTLWVAQFFLLDRVLFRSHPATGRPGAVEEGQTAGIAPRAETVPVGTQSPPRQPDGVRGGAGHAPSRARAA